MTAEAHHYDDLHRLVDRLNPGQADAVRAVVLQLVTVTAPVTEPLTNEEPVRRRTLSITGIINAEPDLAERSEDILRELVERDR